MNLAGSEDAAMQTIVYGLRVQSNTPLPWCIEKAIDEPDLSLSVGPKQSDSSDTFDGMLWYVSPYLDPVGVPGATIFRSATGHFRLTYSDGSTFLVDARGREVRANWEGPDKRPSTLAYLLGPVLGWVLRLRGITCLHASALAVRGKALLLVGTEGAGKSTTAAALLRKGHPVLSDDVACLTVRDEAIWVSPGLPRLLLGDEASQALWGQELEVPSLFPGSDKGCLDATAACFRYCDQDRMLGAVYFLEQRQKSLARPLFAAVTGAAGLSRLAVNTFANRVPDEAMIRSDFELLGQLINRYPVRSVTASDDLEGLDQLCNDLLDDFQAVCG
jgi:hypothetical protein